MGSDRARRSYDARRQYASVVMQQGRVFLEADWNEQWEIHDAEARRTALDLIGPYGTPDGGYQIATPAVKGDYDFSIAPGTMYVGGRRVSIPELTRYSNQRGWAPAPGLAIPAKPRRELVYLEIHEQEVSAVEDGSLLDPALGGPDTAQRLRLTQHIRRVATNGKTCQEAFEEQVAGWQKSGLNLNRKTMRLESQCSLKVDYPLSWQVTDSIEASGRSGYIGTDNQLIRIQICASGERGGCSIVWGFDNASFLYEVDVANDYKTLTLKSSPVDVYHEPRLNQTVEILQSAEKLDDDVYVAALTGLVTTVARPYDHGAQSIAIKDPLGAEYYDTAQNPRVFLRVWEEQIAFDGKNQIALGDTGLTVTLKGESFQVGDHWLIAVRRNTPMTVYPERYLRGFQPPEGPIRSVAPLAVILWSESKEHQVTSCPNGFGSLGEVTKEQAGGCCTVTVRPEDITPERTLQDIITAYQGRALTLCLMPGVYLLSDPIRLYPENSYLTMAGCEDGAVLRPAETANAGFIDGLIVLCQAHHVTFDNLQFELPQVSFQEVGSLANLHVSDLHALKLPPLGDLAVSIGIRPVHCAVLTIKNCEFRFPASGGRSMFGACIFAGSECHGLKLQHNRFEGREVAPRGEPFSLLAGYLLASTVTFRSGEEVKLGAGAVPAGAVVGPLLDDALFHGNSFEGLAIATLIIADAGTVRFTDNTIRGCYAGFWLISPNSLIEAVAVPKASQGNGHQQQFSNDVQTVMRDPLIYIGGILARGYPIPPLCEGVRTTNVARRSAIPTVKGETAADLQEVVTRIESWWGRLIPWFNKERAESKPENLDEATVTEPSGVRMQEIPERFHALSQLVTALESAWLAESAERPRLVLSLHCSGNDIESIDAKQVSSTMLLVWDDLANTGSGVIVSANKLHNRAPHAPTALIIGVDRTAITGNHILNDDGEIGERRPPFGESSNGPSLDLFPMHSPKGQDLMAAVTGNVFMGPTTIGDVWKKLNAGTGAN